MTSDSLRPKVGVLMAVRDGAQFLPETLASLAALHHPAGGIEFVIIDDASTDATPRLLAEWARNQDGVQIITADHPLGLPKALNTGLAAIQAPLVARADADDLYAPSRLVKQVAAFAADPDLGVLGCGYRRIDPDGRSLGEVVPPTGPDILRFRMMLMNPLLHPGVMFRTSLVREVGGYDKAYWTAQDSDLWARLAGHTRIDNLTEALVHYRVHPGSVMKQRGAAGQALSLSVPERLQSAYLGGHKHEYDMQDHDVAATVQLFQGFVPLEPAALRRGMAGLAAIDKVAQNQERAVVLADFRNQAAASMWRHAWWIKRRAPGLALRLAARGAHWRLSQPAASAMAAR